MTAAVLGPAGGRTAACLCKSGARSACSSLGSLLLSAAAAGCHASFGSMAAAQSSLSRRSSMSRSRGRTEAQ